MITLKNCATCPEYLWMEKMDSFIFISSVINDEVSIKKSWNFPCVSISTVPFWQVCVFFLNIFQNDGNDNMVWTLTADHYCCTEKFVLTGRKTTFCHIQKELHNLRRRKTWYFGLYSANTADAKSQNKKIQGHPYFSYLWNVWNTRIKLHGFL